MDDATLAVVVALTGFIGGIAGFIAAVWTIVWALTLRPRVRWSLNRFRLQFQTEPHVFPPNTDGTVPPPMPAIELDPHQIHFYFRNVGTIAADDAHLIVRYMVKGERRKYEFPTDGRVRVEPGEEISVQLPAIVIEGKSAGRPYIAGDDTVFDLKGAVVTVRWRRQTAGLARRFFFLNREQLKVPFV